MPPSQTLDSQVHKMWGQTHVFDYHCKATEGSEIKAAETGDKTVVLSPTSTGRGIATTNRLPPR